MKDNEKKLGVKNYNDFFSANKEEPGITLVLQNGEVLIDEIKKAQQQSAELQKTLEHIKHFYPEFRMK